MRVRLLVLGCFLTGLLVPVLLAYGADLLHEADADAKLDRTVAVGLRVAPLDWPARPLGLTASDGLVVWQQTGAEGGLWVYDAARRETRRLVGAAEVGDPLGPPTMSGPTVVWTARARRQPQIRILDTDVLRVSHASGRAVLPATGGNTVAWVWRRPAGDVIGVLDTVTGVRARVTAGGRVQALVAAGSWIAWGTGAQGHQHVYALRYARPGLRYLLASAATALAMDADRILWAAPTEHGRAALVAWDRSSRHSEQLAEVPGPVSSLTILQSRAAWTRRLPDGADVWASDLRTGRAYPVSAAPGDQVFPVLAGRTLFWADHGGERWVLRARRLAF